MSPVLSSSRPHTGVGTEAPDQEPVEHERGRPRHGHGPDRLILVRDGPSPIGRRPRRLRSARDLHHQDHRSALGREQVQFAVERAHAVAKTGQALALHE
jgi:hypothetical protein